MANAEVDTRLPELKFGTGAESVEDSVENESSQLEAHDGLQPKNSQASTHLVMVYSRSQLIFLQKSPLVKPPSDMPQLKDWFGSENEQNLHRKDPESSNSTNTRDRRFRRDPEDGEVSTRTTFRTTLTQPSQMGNFKHQSLRSNDRDRDREIDKDRERDMREKEGQEKLRNLSDKYDRERLTTPGNMNNLRNKPRDAAGHSTAGASRHGPRNQIDTSALRQVEPKDSGKKKAGETSEDWRRGAEPPRPVRDDRSENRKDSDERERPRSRVRDSSRSRRELSISRRDRDRDDRDRDRRDRDEFRGDYLRRDRDDPDVEQDDPRRWRDDGKRDERMAARRERHVDRDHRDRARDKPLHDTWEPSHDRYQERRWTVVEERDGRSKRNARDRRSGLTTEEGKDRDREKEKEPAWMDAYIPSGSGVGILGGKGGDGELDGIQEWKKGMKEKEQQESRNTKASEKPDPGFLALPVAVEPSSTSTDKQLDEIQLFKLMMKNEQEKKKPLITQDTPPEDARLTVSSPHGRDGAVSGLMRIREQKKGALVPTGAPADTASDLPTTSWPTSSQNPLSFTETTKPQISTQDEPVGSHTLLSIFSSESGAPSRSSASRPAAPPDDATIERPKGSRFFPSSLQSEHQNSATEKASLELTSTVPPSITQANPPQGSRLLALGARSSSRPLPASTHPSNGSSANVPSQPFPHTDTIPSGPHSDPLFTQRNIVSEPLRAQPHFESHSRSAPCFDDPHERTNLALPNEPLRPAPVPERPPGANVAPEAGITHSEFAIANHVYNTGNPSSTYDLVNGVSGNVTTKGSRFAKFFDGKARDHPAGTSNAQGPVDFMSSTPNPSQRHELAGFNGVSDINADNRAVDELFAMLSNSTHGQQRITPINQSHLSSIPFRQNPSNLHSLHHQQPQQTQHIPSGSRLDSFYESRSDDRNFVPDGMVPGLRSTAVRNRDNGSMFSEAHDESFNSQRLGPQHRGLDQIYPGPVPSLYSQQTGVGRSIVTPIQQSQYRGGPSPIPNQSLLQGGQQRLPPGLANLGGRPPHEPSHFLGQQMGVPSGGLHSVSHGSAPSQPSFNNFTPGTSVNFSGGPQMRGPPPGAHPLQSSLHNTLVHPSGVELRGPNQLLGSNGGGLRGGGVTGFGPQHGPNGHIQAPLLALRQQQPQQQHLPPHMMSHLLPPGHPVPDNQPGPDLMALLMGNHHRG